MNLILSFSVCVRACVRARTRVKKHLFAYSLRSKFNKEFLSLTKSYTYMYTRARMSACMHKKTLA